MIWQTKKIAEICEIARGGSPRPIKVYITNSEDGVNWIKISDATSSDKYIFETKQKIKKEGLHKTRMVYPGDFILTNSMSFGRPYIMKTEGAIHDGWLLLRPKKEILDEEYLYYFLSSDEIYKQFKKIASGAVVQNLNSELVRGVEITLPPLETQKEIVAKLDKKFARLHEAKKLREEALADTEKILSQTLREIFEEGKKNGWKEKKIEEISRVGTGGTPLKGNKEYYGGLIPWVTSKSTSNFFVSKPDDYITDLAVKETNCKLNPIGTLLIAMYGQGKTRGQVSELLIEASTNQAIATVLIKSKEIVNSFVKYYFLFNYEKMRQMAEGGPQLNLNLNKIKKMIITVPTLPEQQRIVDKLEKLSEKIRELRELQKSQLEDIKKLEKAYLREAFRGELI
jgi:type I restriction enzyme S subunit